MVLKDIDENLRMSKMKNIDRERTITNKVSVINWVSGLPILLTYKMW